MPSVAFFPWLHLSAPLRMRGFELLPYRRGTEPVGRGAAEQAVLDMLLEPYRQAPMAPIDRATLLRMEGKGLLDDLTDEQADQALRGGELVAFAGLAARRFFDQLAYTNRETFRLIVQRFTDPASGMAVVTRRRDGVSMIAVTKSAMMIQKPYHVSAARAYELDAQLLGALLERTQQEGWGEIEEAITGFNGANTDSPDVREESEAVALVGALERLLGLRGGDDRELADAFVAAVTPRSALRPDDCPRVVSAPRRERHVRYPSLREAWIRDFFRLRGDHAHGKIAPRYSSVWTLREHLLLGSFVFPLVLKARLVREGVYTFTDHDLAAIEAFEQLACLHPFHTEEEDGADQEANGSGASGMIRSWSRVLEDAHTRRLVERWIATQASRDEE